ANTRAYQERTHVHRLLVGGGLKMPVGRDDLRIGEELASHDIQLGTGSWDGLFSVEYAVRRGRTAGGVSALARFNTANAAGHRMGHGLSTTAEVFHRFGGDSLSFAPAIGAYMERMGQDHMHDMVHAGTGGTTLFTHAGLRAWWKGLSFSAYYQHAVMHRVGHMMTPTRHRIVVGLTCNLNNKNT
ncbi:MAG: hypothetical protein RBT71_05690, partial [Flavobacteriales bacterium]|nr:hypothetical protein [Flavobacteriales bacterium]